MLLFWVSVSALLLALFGFVRRMSLRVREEENNSTTTVNSNCMTQEKSPISWSLVDPEETQSDVSEFMCDKEFVSVEEEEAPKFFSKFQFRRYEEFIGSNVGNGDSDSDSAPTSSTNKYEFMSGNVFGVLMEEPQAKSFTVEEFFSDSNNGSNSFSNEESKKQIEGAEAVHIVDSEKVTHLPNEGVVEIVSQKESLGSDFDSDSIVSSYNFSGFGQFIDSNSDDAFLSDKDFETESGSEDVITSDEDIIMEELKEAEDDDDALLDSNMLSQKDFHEDDNKQLSDKDNESSSNSDIGKSKVEDCEDSNGFESLWEHQELIEQLKMELKKVRATGLPTILEESESPKMMEDLKPWKIEEKMERQDTMSELHRFYSIYRERMRKFDIFNYQKMYAIGFLQSKDPLQSISISKSSVPMIGSLLSESLRVITRKKSKSDPMVKFMRELHSDLEMVYVGQMCLSWEFLQWQYEKTLELWESDPRGIRRYNEVAGEFQQFQVLMQRFMENEPFEGPRVQNYVKNRCILRNLLQVPVIREDAYRDKGKAKIAKGDDAITSDMLVEIMEESIRIFWRFIRADKDTNSKMQVVRRENQVEIQDPADKKLLMELREDLHKKERKVKDILSSGNCILRRFLRQREEEEESSEQVLYFFSQVDMKLVSRVLNMSRITSEQLLWCHNKLSNISFVNGKIHVEPSFLLFPC